MILEKNNNWYCCAEYWYLYLYDFEKQGSGKRESKTVLTNSEKINYRYLSCRCGNQTHCHGRDTGSRPSQSRRRTEDGEPAQS